MKGQGKLTDISARIRKIYQLLLNGSSNTESVFHLISEIAKREKWAVTDRQVHNYIRQAREMLAQYQINEIKEYKQLHLARLESAYTQQIIAKDFRGAVRTLDRIAILLGLNAPIELEHTVTKRPQTLEEIRTELERVSKRRKQVEKLTFSTN